MYAKMRLSGAVLVIWLAVVAIVHAQAFPARPVRIVVGSSPAGSTDLIARTISPAISSRFGQPALVENRPGAGGMLAREYVASAAPDGYTALIDQIRGRPGTLLLVTGIATIPYALVVHPSVPVRNVKELIAFARNTPGKLSYGSTGPGSSPHLAMDRFQRLMKIDMVHVPYKGTGPVIIDLISGHIQVSILPIGSALPHMRSGKLRILGTTGVRRTPLTPDIPTIDEAGGAGYSFAVSFGLYLPRDTPAPIADSYRTAVREGLQRAEIQSGLRANGMEPDPTAAEGDPGGEPCPSGTTYCKCVGCIANDQTCPTKC